MKKKLLIWDITYQLKDCGGPTGYLYNIHEYMKDYPTEEIIFMSDLLNRETTNVLSDRKKIKDQLKKSFGGRFICDLVLLYNLYFQKLSYQPPFDLNEYDFIHFHKLYDLQRYQNALRYYKGKVVLTSHMPEPPFDETLNGFIYYKAFFRIFRNYFIRREVKIAEKLVSKWIFPTKYSIEPYTNLSRFYKDYFNANQDKLYFIPTGIIDKPSEKDDKFCPSLGIPKDKFKILYLGRHNEVKGYDELKQIANELFKTSNDYVFVIGGKEEPLTRLEHENWIELGWVNYASKLISNCDLFILPNKETYFDLVALEVLRAGTPILLTLTGGNKFLVECTNTESAGILAYNRGNIDEAVSRIREIKKSLLPVMGKNNRELWAKYFTLGTFMENYLNFVREA